MSPQPTKIAGVVLASLLFAFSALARDRSVLNGTWTLAPTKSDFAGQPAVETGTVTIEDKEGIVVITRKLVYKGATETFFYNDSSGNELNMTAHDGKSIKTKTRWDHDVLKVTTTRNGAVTSEDYSLNPDGTMSVHVISPNRKPITLVFNRQ